MAFHSNETGLSALHPIWLAQNGDPGAIGAGKLWLDTTNGATLEAGAVLKERDGADTGWTTRTDLKTATGLGVTTLTDGATITWTVTDMVEDVATVTLGGNRTLAISGAAAGFRGTLIVKQDATGSRTLTLPGSSKVTGGGAGAITLTATASAIDVLGVLYDGTNYFWTAGLNAT
jgi:hypothetical protein